MNKLRKNEILGIEVTTASKEEVLEYLFSKLEKTSEKFYIVTPNPEFVILANKNPEFKAILNKAEIAIPDGVGLTTAGKILGRPFKEKVSGIDLMYCICEESVGKPIRIGLLGAREGVAERAAECLLQVYPDLNIIYAAGEWSEGGYKNESKIQDFRFKKQEKILTSHANDHSPMTIDILFVAFGAPKQEQWISENLVKLPVRMAMGVGGSFDYISGDVKRAPQLIRKMGFEWLYRLVTEPWRWKRQIALIKFIQLVAKEKLKSLF